MKVFNPDDLNFELPTYNPTNSPTTSSGGYKPSKPSGNKGSGGNKGSSEKEEKRS